MKKEKREDIGKEKRFLTDPEYPDSYESKTREAYRSDRGILLLEAKEERINNFPETSIDRKPYDGKLPR